MGKTIVPRSRLVDALVVDVIRMRVAQRRYFLSRSHRDLVAAKFREKAVDQLLDQVVPGWFVAGEMPDSLFTAGRAPCPVCGAPLPGDGSCCDACHWTRPA